MSERILDEKWDNGLRVFIVFLRGLFKDRDKGDFRWDADPSTSDIYIASAEPEDINSTMPRILVGRGAINYTGSSISQSTPRMFARTEALVADLQSAVITITVASTLPIEAHCLGMHVFSMLAPFREMLACQGKFHSLLVVNASITQPMPITNFLPGSLFNKMRAVQISIPSFMQEVHRVSNAGFYSQLEEYVLAEIKTST